MKASAICLSVALVIVLVEYYVMLWPFHVDMFTAPGPCYGYTTFYNAGFGSDRWDCLGNRHPDDEVDVSVSPAAPEEAIVGDPERGPR